MLNYIEIGKGEPLILIHGLSQRYDEAWKPQFELAKHYRLIIPALRGHFGNEKSDITMENYAKDIIELLEHLHIESAYIAGLSLGGIIAIEIYKQRPDLIKGLILCNTTHQIPAFIGNKIVNASERCLNKSEELLIEKIVNKSIYNNKYFDKAKQTFYISDQYIEASRASIGCNYADTLRKIDKPTLLIGGYFDLTTPPFAILMMKYLIRHAEMKMLQSGHLSNIERKDEFNYWIKKFIEQNT